MDASAQKARLPAGLRDVLPPDAAAETETTARLLAAFASRGYEQVDPPLLEFEESLLIGAGAATAEQTFRLMDPVSHRMMGLRTDITVQVARIATTRLRNLPRPLRLCYAGQVLRVKGTQLRPDRQFGQAGIELIGSDSSAADAEIDRLRDFYQLHYPSVAEAEPAAINGAIAELKVLYRLTATPEMRVTATTYPDNLGHTDFAGCFRCHDGGHYLVKDGAATKTAIPSSCDTCHTFPQIGGASASLPLGVPPDTHDDRLWVFNHRLVAKGEDPGTNSCGECHARDYCSNCHATGAITVDHDEMLTNHAAVIRTSGAAACAYCHQPVYCARCHSEQVLPGSGPIGRTGAIDQPAGLQWPLLSAAIGR